MRPRERQETGEQDLFRSGLDRIIDLVEALARDRLAVFGGAVRVGLFGWPRLLCTRRKWGKSATARRIGPTSSG